jgi:hypothetical protein
MKPVNFIVVIALFFQAMIPLGFMPSFANDTISIEICSGAANKTIQLQGEDSDDSESSPSHCPFTTVSYSIFDSDIDRHFITFSYSAINFTKFQTPDVTYIVLSGHQTRAPPFLIV